jgi:hypothetical protein
MARDYEDFSSIDDLDDAELRQLIRDRLADQQTIDVDDIDVIVEDGTVRLEGPRSAGALMGEMPPQQSDEVMEARGDEDLDERMFGTTDVHDAIAHGTTYIPPDAPTPEGLLGTDAGPGEYGEDH